MSEPKKQHYVPQTYLKNFSTIEHLKDKYIWENIYAKHVEPSLGELLHRVRFNCENKLIQNNATVITEEQKILLSINIVIQMFRGKHARIYEKKLYNELFPEIFSDAKKRFPEMNENVEQRLFQKYSTDDNYFKAISMKIKFDDKRMKNLSEILVRRNFVFYRINGHASSFVTSDNPVIFMDLVTQNVKPFSNGLINPTTIVYFPISPKLLLTVYHPNVFWGCLNNMDCSLQIIDSLCDKNFIDTCNIKRFEHCDKYVYANSKDVLENIGCKIAK